MKLVESLLCSAVLLLSGCSLKVEFQRAGGDSAQLEAVARQLSENDKLLAQKIVELSKEKAK